MIDFENQIKKPMAMTQNPFDVESEAKQTSEQTVEVLWEIFEKTGSVDAYLTYLKKVGNLQKKKTASVWPS